MFEDKAIMTAVKKKEAKERQKKERTSFRIQRMEIFGRILGEAMRCCE